MEVSRKRLFQKHLEPARPLRRCPKAEVTTTNVCSDQRISQPITAAPVSERPVPDYKITLEQFFRIVNLNKSTDRICYTRDFLMGLAGCAEARKKPPFLPEHLVVLSEAREELTSEDLDQGPPSRFGGAEH